MVQTYALCGANLLFALPKKHTGTLRYAGRLEGWKDNFVIKDRKCDIFFLFPMQDFRTQRVIRVVIQTKTVRKKNNENKERTLDMVGWRNDACWNSIDDSL